MVQKTRRCYAVVPMVIDAYPAKRDSEYQAQINKILK